MAHQPVVVKREDRWNSTFRKQVDDARREARQVVDVRDVGSEVVDEAARDCVDRVVRVRLFERPCVSERVVDAHDPQAVALFLADGVLGALADPARA